MRTGGATKGKLPRHPQTTNSYEAILCIEVYSWAASSCSPTLDQARCNPTCVGGSAYMDNRPVDVDNRDTKGLRRTSFAEVRLQAEKFQTVWARLRPGGDPFPH